MYVSLHIYIYITGEKQNLILCRKTSLIYFSTTIDVPCRTPIYWGDLY